MIEGIGKVGVVGLGVMGFDIAFLYAMKGFHTSVYDASKAVMESLTDRREQTLERLKRRNRISDNETENIRKLLMPAADLASLSQADLITEAVLENAHTKSAVYPALKATGYERVLTANPSTLPRKTLLGGGGSDRGKFATDNFLHPVP